IFIFIDLHQYQIPEEGKRRIKNEKGIYLPSRYFHLLRSFRVDASSASPCRGEFVLHAVFK
ncbi:hypothetical protein, partial [Akkermansia sp.]|uniref:hypothetical protein n=1 Tax=Akkermansia sp. TaxID=1872421 RepID=UPI003AACF475